MTQLLDASAKGVYTISATPFTDVGDIDWKSVDSLIEFYLQCGVHGHARLCFGCASNRRGIRSRHRSRAVRKRGWSTRGRNCRSAPI
jgi:hypothetical protein